MGNRSLNGRGAAARIGQRFTAAVATGDWPAALRLGRTLVELAPGEARHAYNLALVLRRLGRNGEALALLERACTLAPEHAGAGFERAAALMDQGRLAAARDAFAAYQQRWPDDPDAVLNLAWLELRLARPVEAAALFRRLLALRPDAPAVLLGLAQAELEGGDADAGAQRLRSLWRAHPAGRPAALKAMTQCRRGRVPLRSSRLSG